MSKLVDHGEESIRTISLTERPAGAVLSVGVTPDHRAALIRCGMAHGALDVAGVTDMITALEEARAVLESALTTGKGSGSLPEYREDDFSPEYRGRGFLGGREVPGER